MLNRGRACQDTKRDCAAEAVLDFTRLALERIKHSMMMRTVLEQYEFIAGDKG